MNLHKKTLLSYRLRVVAVLTMAITSQCIPAADSKPEIQLTDPLQAQKRAKQHAKFRIHTDAESLAELQAKSRTNSRKHTHYSSYHREDEDENSWAYATDKPNRNQLAHLNYKNWQDQRAYLISNLSRYKQLGSLNRQQREQIDKQMRAAYHAYNGKKSDRKHDWTVCSDPRFIDYLKASSPSLFQDILSSLGVDRTNNNIHIQQY